ncbi:MAG: bis-aminopropyl spermidine synthase family protein [Candidatus Nealsonbacteria bacterium]
MDLKKLHQKYLRYSKESFLADANIWVGTEAEKLSKKDLERIYDNYERKSFNHLFKKIKDIIYLKNLFDFSLIHSTENWVLLKLITFLEKEKVISVNKLGKIKVLEEELFNLMPKPLSVGEIKKRVEKKIGKKINLLEPTSKIFGTKILAEYDQMPISNSSAIFLVEKILKTIPFKKRFLFVGDDDMVSLFLCIADPGIECLVTDIDTNLLKKISRIAKKYNLKITTQKVDIRKVKSLGGGFGGFLVNPSYNYEGVKKFVEFGVSQLGKEGGFAFVEIGDESIGNRFLFLEEIFAKNNLIIRELSVGNIFYPWTSVHGEDKVLIDRLSKFFDKDLIKSNPKLAASLWLFEYIPFKVKKPKKQSIYAYI